MSDHLTKPSCLLRAVIKSDNSPCECRIMVAMWPERDNDFLRHNAICPPATQMHYVIKIKIDGKALPAQLSIPAEIVNEPFPPR